MENSPEGGRKALGRGLAALIPSAPVSNAPPPAADTSGIRELPIERVKPNPTQPRKFFAPEALTELAKSIELRGVLQPVIVRRRGDTYEIVAGERRWRAAQKAGLQSIPAVIKEFTDTGALEVALIENIQRQDLDPLEEAEAYHRLMEEHGLTQDRVAAAVGKSRSAVANALRLLKLPESVLEMLADGRLTPGHARAIMMLDDPTEQKNLASDIVQRKSTVRDAERKARLMRRSANKVKPKDDKSPAQFALEERLQRALGTKVRVHHRKGKGRVEVFFHSLDQLDAILAKIDP